MPQKKLIQSSEYGTFKNQSPRMKGVTGPLISTPPIKPASNKPSYLPGSSYSPMLGGRSPAISPQIFHMEPTSLGAKQPQGNYVVNFLCIFYFWISMVLKSELPFMVDFFKSVGFEWIFGTYNGIYYFGRILANLTVGPMSRWFKVRQLLYISLFLDWIGTLCFAAGVYYPSWVMMIVMLVGKTLQGFATGMMAGAVGMYIQLFHRGDMDVTSNFAVAYNVGDICGPILSLPFYAVGLKGLCVFLLLAPLPVALITARWVPSGLVPIQMESDDEGEGPKVVNRWAKFYLYLAAGLSAFYTSYEFNIPILYDSLGYGPTWMSFFLDIMAVAALSGSLFAKYLPNKPQMLNELFMLFLAASYLISAYPNVYTYIFTMVVVCIVGEFQGIVNSTVVLAFLTIEEYGIWRSFCEGGRVVLQPIFSYCLENFPGWFFIFCTALHSFALLYCWGTKPLGGVTQEAMEGVSQEAEIENEKEV